MKVLAFTDIHSSITAFKKIEAKIKKHKPDILFCTGDITVFEQNIEAVMHKLDDLGKPVLLLHGNHEEEAVVRKLAKKCKNITFMHRAIADVGDYHIVAHGGGGFYDHPAIDPDFDKFIKKNKDKIKKPIILLTHAPPANTKLDYISWMDDHVGCESYTDFIKEFKPMLAISGHIHESFGEHQKIGPTLVCNPGPEGMVFSLEKGRTTLLR